MPTIPHNVYRTLGKCILQTVISGNAIAGTFHGHFEKYYKTV